MVTRALLWSMAVAMLLPIAAAGVYLAHGSFEMFPDAAQDEQARLAAGVVLMLAVLLELAIVVLLVRTRSRK